VPAFIEAEDEEQRVFVGGAAGLLDDVRDEEMGAYRSLIDLLERRRAMLDLLSEALDPRRPFVRVGDELANAGLHDLALVGAAYGIANRTLGAVSLIGPSRMDYDKAIRTVRSAASELSRFAEIVYGDN
jgi:heat-inducible transcriptional repressor